LIALYADVKERVPARDRNGLRPTGLQTGDKTQNAFLMIGGPDRTRTYDPALIKRML
jgi:hypothetical protein